MNSKDFIGKGSAYIADTLAKSKGTPLSPEFYVLQEYLKAELNRELIESQKEYQDESFNQMQQLVKATWALAIGTFILCVVTLVVSWHR